MKPIFPMKVMNISQTYKQGNHIPHWKGAEKGKKDYPIDITGKDSGRDILYAPCDCKITFIQAKNSLNWTNKMILVSTCKVDTVKYGTKQIFFKCVHFPYSNVAKYGLKVGKTFRQGEAFCTEGKDNYSTGNHIHFSCGIGYADKSIPNKNGKYVANGDNKYPENILWVDTDFTIIKNAGGLKWHVYKKEIVEYYKKCSNKYTSIVDALKSIGVDSSFSNRKKIANANGIKVYVGTAKQNNTLLKLLIEGKLKKAK